ncbi:MAG: fused MFS/spermidine synthase [Planctomycetes bacterium]|nr:fused MFS/spermidine synthase [Planctomycetota bacterium]
MSDKKSGTGLPGDEYTVRAFTLRAIAFLCGASLMGLEMAGVRILEPHFGSTIYVWGSIIGIFLGALSLGYWIGGIVADKFPRLNVLGYIIALAALMTFLIPIIATPLCRELSGMDDLGPRTRALLGSIMLYAVPSVLMGMVSPFAVRLAARNVTGLGSVAGGLYAFSTLGSLFGTFLVSFVLTEVIGSKTTVFAIGALLLAVGIVCCLSHRKAVVTIAAAACLIGFFSFSALSQSDVRLWNPEADESAVLTDGSVFSWRDFYEELDKASAAKEGTHKDKVMKHFLSSLNANTISLISTSVKNRNIKNDEFEIVLNNMNDALKRRDLFPDPFVKEIGIVPPYHMQLLLDKGRESWSVSDTLRFNRLFLRTALPKSFCPVSPTGYNINGDPAAQILEDFESVYHSIAVVEDDSLLPNDKRRARRMMFNNLVESAVIVSDDGSKITMPVESACGYTRLLHLGLLATEKAPKRILIIGCGGGVGPQVFENDYSKSVECIDVVDIDPSVFAMAQKYFNFPAEGESNIIHRHVKDGRLFLVNSKEKWDYIVLDAYTAGGRIPRHLVSQEFFRAVQEHLSDGGVLVANVISAIEGDRSRLYRSCWKTMDTVFENVYAFPRHRLGNTAENIILVASDEKARISSMEMKQRFQELNGTVIKQKDLEEVVIHASIVAPPLDDVPLLTDDFCPTDSMVHD